MRKILTFLVLLLLVIVLIPGCVAVNISPLGNATVGRGTPEKYEYQVSSFNKIRVEGHCDINYYAAPSHSVTLEVQPNLKELFVIEVIDSELIIRNTAPIRVSDGFAPTLTVSLTALNSINILGASTFITHDEIATESLSISISGAGRVNAEIAVDRLQSSIAGAGSLDLRGSADLANLSLAGAGDIHAFSLQTKEASISIAGAGLVQISCSENLIVNAQGVGTVEYRGTPEADITRGGLVTISKVD